MRIHSLLIPSIMIFLLSSWASCSHQGGTSGQEVNPSILSQLDSLSVSGTKRASLLVGIRGRPREMRFTSDGGVTWQMIDSSATGGMLECATFSDGIRGWAVNHDGQVFTTNTGVVNWMKLADLKALPSGDFTGASQIEFVTETDGWIKEFLSIWRTRDGGITWKKSLSVLTPGVKGQPGYIHAIDANTLVGLGDGQVYLTKDGGETWKIKTLISGEASFTNVWFTDKQKGWLTGYVGVPEPFRPLLFTTSDGGESWEEINLADVGILPESICFVDQKDGWLAGRRPVFTGKPVSSGGILLHTTDGGRHWIPAQVDSIDPFFNVVQFTDKVHGWLAGRDNLYRTDDGGNTWRRVLTLPPAK
jgi:photosystem II stability/assembly factor-like uncharacterized protein